MGWAAMKPRIAARMGPSLEGLCYKFQMQTSLSPSVCRAFLGCQIEKVVDELNLSKKIISWGLVMLFSIWQLKNARQTRWAGPWLGRGLAPCSVGSAYLLLPVSSGSASLAKP